MSVITVKNKIIEFVNDMQTLKHVQGFQSLNLSGKYPTAIITLSEGDGTFESNAHNLRRRQFNVDIFQEQTKEGQGEENAERIIIAILDELEKHFDANTTLSGACHYATPVSFEAEWIDREVDTRILRIKIDAYELVSAS